MKLKTLIEYKNWADRIYIDYCKKIGEVEIHQTYPGYDKSIYDIIFHIYEVCWEWFHVILVGNYEDIDEPDPGMSTSAILSEIEHFGDLFLEFIDSNDLSETRRLQWQESDNPVDTTVENILFNFVSHSAYHRGQLAIMLRMIGIETIEETDFNPYIYQLFQ